MTTDPLDNPDLADRVRSAMQPAPLDPAFRARLLERAAPELERRRGRRTMVWRIGAPGLAAALVLAAGLAVVFGVPGGTPGRAVALGPNDINADGAIDILDARALARAVETGNAAPDLDGDGNASLADADWLALRVVSLEGTG